MYQARIASVPINTWIPGEESPSQMQRHTGECTARVHGQGVVCKRKTSESSSLGPTDIPPAPISQNSNISKNCASLLSLKIPSLTSLASPTHVPPANFKSVIWFKFLSLPLSSDLGKGLGPHGTQFPHVERGHGNNRKVQHLSLEHVLGLRSP